MPNDPMPLYSPISTPCVGICQLNPHGFCIGCRRSGDEIARWRGMSEAERRHCMDVVLPVRKAS